jgi:hypothetical protein
LSSGQFIANIFGQPRDNTSYSAFFTLPDIDETPDFTVKHQHLTINGQGSLGLGLIDTDLNINAQLCNCA